MSLFWPCLRSALWFLTLYHGSLIINTFYGVCTLWGHVNTLYSEKWHATCLLLASLVYVASLIAAWQESEYGDESSVDAQSCELQYLANMPTSATVSQKKWGCKGWKLKVHWWEQEYIPTLTNPIFHLWWDERVCSTFSSSAFLLTLHNTQ